MGIPNLFILGAGKFGTTSLYHLLERHPEIQVCDPKEPSFFCSYFQVVDNPVTYFGLFDAKRRYRVDASHVYFSNPETPILLRDLFPQAKFILTLRHPKMRAQSLYQHMRRALHSDGQPMELVDSFREALSVESERFRSKEFRLSCRQYFWNFMYMRSSYYDEQLSRYLNIFPRGQFLITTLGELHNQPQKTTSNIADFLDLNAADFGQELPFTNVAPAYDAFDKECDSIMESHFGDLTDRVDALAGRRLDWSL